MVGRKLRHVAHLKRNVARDFGAFTVNPVLWLLLAVCSARRVLDENALRQTKGVAFGKRYDAGCKLDGCVPFDFSFLWHMI